MLVNITDPTVVFVLICKIFQRRPFLKFGSLVLRSLATDSTVLYCMCGPLKPWPFTQNFTAFRVQGRWTRCGHYTVLTVPLLAPVTP